MWRVTFALYHTLMTHTHTHTHTHTRTHAHTHTPGRTPLNEWSALRRGRYMHNTQQTQQRNIYSLAGIRSYDPGNQVAAHPCLRQKIYLFICLELFLPAHCRCSGLLSHFISLQWHTHTHTHTHSVGLLWTSDQPVAEKSTWENTTLTRDREAYPRRDSNL